GRLVLVQDEAGVATAVHAVTGETVGPVAAGEAERLRLNNRVRTAAAAALSRLRLASPDSQARLVAAQAAVRHASADNLVALRTALATETDGRVRDAMTFALRASQLAAGGPEERSEAVAALHGSLDPQVRALLGRVVADESAEPALREAAAAAVAAGETRLRMIEFGMNLFQGVSLGSILLLAAMGLAITFGVMGVINMAHGEMIMIGAYSAFVVQELFRAFLPPGAIDLYLLAALPVAFLVAGAVGVAIERGVIRFLYGRPLETLLATWGISLILQQVVRSIFGAPNKQVSNPSWMTGGFEVAGGMVITWNRLAIIVFCIIVFLMVLTVIRYSAFGLQMRAVTQNRDMARSMGINSARVDALTFGLGSGIAGIAGVALSQVGNVSPNLGQLYIVDSFMVVVFGGVGNLAGTLVGAMTLGIVNKFLEPVAGAVLGKVAVLVLIILFIQRRPRGLFALKGRSAEA
ncbi:MAG: urea ABC transporter permease subunit UrtB, partial [Alphaproteobacteria bacterium]